MVAIVSSSEDFKPPPVSRFSEKVCVLNLGMFLQVKSTDLTSSENEIHALFMPKDNVELVQHTMLGVVIQIKKNSKTVMYLAQKGKVTTCNDNWSKRTYIHSYWSESSIIMWYLLLKGLTRCRSSSDDHMVAAEADSCITVLPTSSSPKAFCAVLTNSESSG